MKQNHLIIKFFLFCLVFVTACSGLAAEESPTSALEISADEFTPIVSATGAVVPTDWARLSMSATGVVDEVLVSEDDSVTAGQVLVRLQGKEQLQAAISGAQLEMASAQSALNDLNENIALIAAQALQDLEGTQDALDDLLNSDMQEASALQAIADAEKAIDSAERRLRIIGSIAGQADIDAAKAQVILARDALDKAIDDYEPYANKREDNLVRANLLARQASAQQAYDAAVRRLNALLSSGNELDMAVAQADLATARAQLVDVQRKWEQVKDGPNQGDIDLLEAQISKLQKEYDIYLSGPDPDDLAVAEARMVNAQAQMDAARAALGDLELRTPFEGTVGDIFVHQSEWVNIGQPILLLADINHLQVETTDLSEIDLAVLKIGDEAIVTFDALPEVVIRGIVSRIAPKAAEGAGVNYPVTIELSEIPEQLRWGMTAFVDIEVGD